MPDKFDREVALALKAALAFARRQGADEIGGEHLLVGLAAVPSRAASALAEHGIHAARLEDAVSHGAGDARLLAGLGIDLAEVRRRVGDRLTTRWRTRRPRFRTDTRQAITASMQQRGSGTSRRIRSAHVLLALLTTSVAAREVLLALDVDLNELRREVVHAMTQGG